MGASSDGKRAAEPSVTLCELGLLSVELDGRLSPLRGQRAASLIAGLGLAGRSGVGTEELVEMVWPSSRQPPTARQSLANIVLRLRTLHGPEFIESTRRGYRIGEHVRSDREHFLADVKTATAVVSRTPDRALELIEQALSRWRGEPWSGIQTPIAVEADRAHLLQERLDALRCRATTLIAVGRRDAASTDLWELLDADPYDEFARHHLVHLLVDTGQRAEALRTIRDGRRLLAERGLLPDAALTDVEQGLLSAQFRSDVEAEPLPQLEGDFVGRVGELDAIIGRLRDGRLVTVHGPGGSGKTRLAVEVAATARATGGSGFVALAAARSRGQVELAFARGLGLPSNRLDGLDEIERRTALANAAATSAAVLVIDNCEHVLDDVRVIVEHLLARPGRLRLLATSRVPLEIAGEQRYPIPGFTDGVELFRQRSANHGVSIGTDRDAGVVAEICDLVDHLPLAIEIAAAQTSYRTLDEIAGELQLGLEHRDPTQPDPRHETVTSAIRWSHQLLDPGTADAFVRLGVFEAPFECAEAAAVVGTGGTNQILDTLVRHSLLERGDRDGTSRYRLAIPVQQYCATELERRGTASDVAISLAEWLLEFTERPYGDVWWRISVIDEINHRLPHARTAIGALRAVGRVDDATRLASRLGGVARHLGHADELIEVLTELWPRCGDPEATSDALVALAEASDAARRDEIFDRTLGLLARLDGPAGRRHCVYVHCEHSLWLMWAARLTDANYAPAHDELQRARSEPGALDSPINRVQIDHWQSGLHLLDGDWAAAEAAARRALEDSFDTVFDLHATSCLCHALLQLGDPDHALVVATRHPSRHRDNPHGDLLGIVAAIARVQSGDVAGGLDHMSSIQQRARLAPFAIQQDDAAIAIAYVAHLLHLDDLTVRILETGVVGYGPWVGYLVPKMCRDLGIPLQGHSSTSLAEREERSDYYGVVASGTLDELRERHSV